ALRDRVPHDALAIVKALLLVPQPPTIPEGTSAPVINVAWTLQFEMLFYLFFGLLVINRGLALAAALGFLWLAWASGVFALAFSLQDSLWLFAMGMAVAVLTHRLKGRVERPLPYLGAGVALFLAVASDVVRGAYLLEQWNTLLYGAACSLIVFGL